MKFYAALDLHSDNSYLGIIDSDGKRVFKEKLPYDPDRILHTLKPYKEEMAGVAVESTVSFKTHPSIFSLIIF